MTLGIAGIASRMAAVQSRFAPPGGFADVLSRAATARAGSTQPSQPAPHAGGNTTVGAPPPRPALPPAPVLTPPATSTGVVAAAPVGSAPQATGWAERLPGAARPWIGAIDAAARRHGIDPKLLASLVKHESGFRPDARSSAGAIGLAQLMPATARGLGVDPTDPHENLDGGARFLRQMLDRFGRTDLALAAYNAGPGRVARAGGVPQISETQRYVASVMSSYQQLGGAA